jgi:hypothetical protein
MNNGRLDEIKKWASSHGVENGLPEYFEIWRMADCSQKLNSVEKNNRSLRDTVLDFQKRYNEAQSEITRLRDALKRIQALLVDEKASPALFETTNALRGDYE